MTTEAQPPFAQRTAWSRSIQTPLRAFLSTETGGAGVLLVAALAALVWVNVDASSYEHLWETELAIDLGDWRIALSLREWVNTGLMAFFFFVVGLEARREFDLGELRERRRFILPARAGRGRSGSVRRSRSTLRSTPEARLRTAGASCSRPTQLSRSAYSHSQDPAYPTGCGRSCSPSSSRTTSSRSR